jgi:hypothetical protein
MGWERIGPTMGAYDEFVSVDGGALGSGICMVVHGVVRHVF